MKRLLAIIFLSALLWQLPANAQGTRLFIHAKATNNIIPVDVEIADTPDLRSRGLMFRKYLDKNKGMWFVFGNEHFSPFWMKDTPLSLDIIFVDNKGTIVDIIRRTTPFSLDSLWPRSPYHYVLEVNAGFTQKNKVAIGDLIQTN